MIIRNVRLNEDSQEEFVFGQGYSSYKKNELAIEQDILTALYEWKYDCFFALQNGIDWRTRLGGKNQKSLLDNDIARLIENRYGVVSVTNFQSNVLNRAYACSCNVYTIFSEYPITFNFSNEV